MSRSIFRCFSSCFRFALAAMAVARTDEVGRAGSRRRCRGPALPPTGRPGRRRRRRLRPPPPARAPASASALFRPEGRSADSAQRAPTGHTNRPGGTTATAAAVAAATFPTSPKGEKTRWGGGGKRRPASGGQRPSVGCRPLLAGRSHCGHAAAGVGAALDLPSGSKWAAPLIRLPEVKVQSSLLVE